MRVVVRRPPTIKLFCCYFITNFTAERNCKSLVCRTADIQHPLPKGFGPLVETTDLDHLLEAVMIMQGPPAKALDSALPRQYRRLRWCSLVLVCLSGKPQ